MKDIIVEEQPFRPLTFKDLTPGDVFQYRPQKTSVWESELYLFIDRNSRHHQCLALRDKRTAWFDPDTKSEIRRFNKATYTDIQYMI